MVIFLPYLVWYQIFREFCEPISTPLKTHVTEELICL
jgi:hypothetical protein